MSKDAYQSLTTYNGDLYGVKPSYQGIEYDYEIPSNLVVASPGGIDSRTGHYTKGFYGRGNTSSDVYAGQGPRYIDGVYGNLYVSGQTASQAQGYYPANQDYQFYQNDTPQQYIKDPTSIGYENSWIPSKRLHEGADAPISTIEGYQPENTAGDDSFELVEGFTPETNHESLVQKKGWFYLGVVAMFSFLFLFLWAQTSTTFLIDVCNKGTKPTWKVFAMWTVLIGALLGLIMGIHSYYQK
jgi:hypothetical protein